MKVFSRRSLNALGATLLCLWLAGCAGQGGFGRDEETPTFRDASMTVEMAQKRIVPGSSTRADVVAALGPATVIRFDSGFEVWAYRGRSMSVAAQAVSGSAQAELVLLVAPSGVVQKMRIRQPSPPARS